MSIRIYSIISNYWPILLNRDGISQKIFIIMKKQKKDF